MKWQDYRRKAINALKYDKVAANKLSDIIDHDQENMESEEGEIKEVKLEHLCEAQDHNIIVGEEIKLEIIIEAINIVRPIVGFIMKNENGLVLLGDNTESTKIDQIPSEIEEKEVYCIKFIFTIPILPKGKYFITASFARGTYENHKILSWINDAIMIQSNCSDISAGLAGVPMHAMTMEKVNP